MAGDGLPQPRRVTTECWVDLHKFLDLVFVSEACDLGLQLAQILEDLTLAKPDKALRENMEPLWRKVFVKNFRHWVFVPGENVGAHPRNDNGGLAVNARACHFAIILRPRVR